MGNMRRVLLVVLLSLRMTLPLAVADDKPTTLSDARAAVEANVRTSEGKSFDEQFGTDFVGKHMTPLRQCKQTAGDDLRSFWILVKLNKDGTARELLFYPETRLGTCARNALLKEKFVSPPHNEYWVSVYLKVAR